MFTFLTSSWEFFIREFFVCSSVHPNSQKSVYYCLIMNLWKCEYCLIWVLNKSIMFGSNSLKVSLLCDIVCCVIVCDMYCEKIFYHSLIWKELSENVSIVWCLEKCVTLFWSNSMKVSVLFDMRSEKVFSIVSSNCLKVRILFNLFRQFFFNVCFRLSCTYFLTIKMALIKKQFFLYLIFLKLFPATPPWQISCWKEFGSSMVEFLSFIQTGIILSENKTHQAP